MKPVKITIIGCGLIGGSVALALNRRRPEWTVACLDLPDRLPALREAGIGNWAGTLDEAAAHLPESSFVLLAVPVQEILETLRRIRPFLAEGTIVTDAGSTKMQIMAEAGNLVPPGVHFIGGHPMAGSERSGLEAADPLLFSGRVYILCPYQDTPPEALLALMDLVESLPALPVTLDPEEHDRMMATISHLPQLVAVALMQAALARDAGHSLLDILAGRGFLDMTRLAASDFSIWEGILEGNRDAIGNALDQFEASLGSLRKAIAAGTAGVAWEQAALRRRALDAESRARQRKPDLRSIIDRCDQQIMGALGHRMRAVAKIGGLKLNQSAPVTDPDRERRMIRQREDWARTLGLSRELIDDLFAIILKHSTRMQSSQPEDNQPPAGNPGSGVS